MISETGRPATKASALSRMVCMSSALSLPAMRNLACCHTKRDMSRVVRYLRAASPRANQKMDAPTIIVLSTSKNAAAVRSGTTAGAGSTSAAAAEAAPATCARVSSSGTSAERARRPRKGSPGTTTSTVAPPPPSRAAGGHPTLVPSRGGSAGGLGTARPLGESADQRPDADRQRGVQQRGVGLRGDRGPRPPPPEPGADGAGAGAGCGAGTGASAEVPAGGAPPSDAGTSPDGGPPSSP